MCFLAFLLFMVFIAFMAMAAALPNSWLAWCSGSCGEGTPAGSRQHVSTHCHHWKHCIPKFKNRWTCETKTQQEAPSAEKKITKCLNTLCYHFCYHLASIFSIICLHAMLLQWSFTTQWLVQCLCTSWSAGCREMSLAKAILSHVTNHTHVFIQKGCSLRVAQQNQKLTTSCWLWYGISYLNDLERS